MWPFSRSLESYLSKTKLIKVHGVKFKIKKIDPTNYLDGSKVMLQEYDLYKIGKPDSTTPNYNKIKEHYRDIFMSAVVDPKLSRDKEKQDGLFVDNLFTDWDFASQLYSQIMIYTYEKKNSRRNSFLAKSS
jgi:hypothetical protein